MGIGSAIKGALRSDSRTSVSDTSRRLSTPGLSTDGKITVGTERKLSMATDAPVKVNEGSNSVSKLEPQQPFDASAASGADNTSVQKRSSGSYSLPSGTGPGTTGKATLFSDRDKTTATGKTAPDVGLGTAGGASTADVDKEVGNHRQGHVDGLSVDAMPSGRTSEVTMQLNPVTHEHVRHVETEEVQRVKDHERHIHHIQHHTQPLVTSNVLEEKYHEIIRPVTHIRNNHVNTSEEIASLGSQMRQHHDTIRHGAKERTIVDRGMVINEHIQHHVHHVVQPVIEKEIIDKHRIHTTIPIHEVTHEAPIIHQSRDHNPIPVEHYLKYGGTLEGLAQPKDASDIFIKQGKCAHEVDGIAERLEKELQVDNANTLTVKDFTKSNDVEGSNHHP